MTITTHNPATGIALAEYPEADLREEASIISAVHEAFLGWRETVFAERAGLLRQVAVQLRADASRYARMMAEEMGKPVTAGRGEIEKCATACDFYADHAEAFLAPETIETEATRSFVAFPPLGVVLAVMPWNFPFWQVFRFAAPALMAGNGALLKHASNVPGCALAIEALFRKAGFPEDLFRALIVGSKRVAPVIRNRLVRAVTLTGSTLAGHDVAKQAGARIKKTVLELGGSDPYVILADADLEQAATICAASRLINSGQSCIAAKRFIVVESRREEFERLFVERMKAARVGDPLSETTEVGPLARHDLRDALHRQVEGSLAKGARLLLGGRIPDGPGAFYPPTVLTDVRRGMPVYNDETFGPVAAIISARNEAHAIRIANDSPYGLGAAVFTRDVERGEQIAAAEFEAGCCFVNAFVRSDPRLPFGGVKASGHGRELSHYGIKEFVNIKTVYVA